MPVVNIVADRAAAYDRLRKTLRKDGTLDKELEATLKDQWWEDVKPCFGYAGLVGWWLED